MDSIQCSFSCQLYFNFGTIDRKDVIEFISIDISVVYIESLKVLLKMRRLTLTSTWSWPWANLRIFKGTWGRTIYTTRIAPLLMGWHHYSWSRLLTEILKFLKRKFCHWYKTVRFLIRNSTSLDLGYRLSPALTASSHE